MADPNVIRERIARVPLNILAALLRIARRIGEGFEGEITIAVKRGGITYIRWTQTETGDSIKEEL
jgi:hypothetical protein